MVLHHNTGLTASVLREIKLASTQDSRALRDFILNISSPEIYDFSIQRFNEMSDSGFNITVGVLQALRDGGISQDGLSQMALEIESGSDQSDTCLEMIGKTSIRVVVSRKHVARVSIKRIGIEKAKKRARWIRDNYLFEIKGSARVRKAPTVRKGRVKRISLLSDIAKNKLVFLVRYKGERGRPTTKQFSVLEMGFEGAFQAALGKAREESPELNHLMANPYKPTNEEFAHFKPLVPDLPSPEEN
ncbi:hypothetical protein [Metapseudomonas otitidis]|uniref:hypothetical protein n=1 Tax=Metapseudomonas otitidis TaxID=319939 RepID=UPI0013F5F27B|nr:hypothetical protein [Pseudomonas otitidis]